MTNLIDELKAIPGVIGACIVNANEGIKATNLPTIFKPERLVLVGNHLLELYAAGQLSFKDLTDITLNFEESVVVARVLDKSIVIFVICEPTFNNNLLNMSLNLLQDEFKGRNLTESAPVKVKSVVVTQDEVDPKLEELFAKMEKSLGKILGPMAEFIFTEILEKWKAEGVIDFSRITELTNLINQEIVDLDKIDHYRGLISEALSDYQEG